MKIDYTHGWEARRNASWSGIRLHVPERTPRKNVKTIVLHQWGIEATLSDAARYRIEKGYTTEEQEWCGRMARAPYHFGATVTTQGSPLSSHVWPAKVYTNHCGPLNSTTVGVGVMGLFPRMLGQSDHAHPVGLADAVQDAVTMAADSLGPGGDPVRVITHSQFSTKSRDPGERIVSALAPLVDEGVIRVDPDFSSGKGQPWPEEWRRYFNMK